MIPLIFFLTTCVPDHLHCSGTSHLIMFLSWPRLFDSSVPQVQHLAHLVGQELVVQNLNIQSDTTDLLVRITVVCINACVPGRLIDFFFHFSGRVQTSRHRSRSPTLGVGVHVVVSAYVQHQHQFKIHSRHSTSSDQ